MSSHPIQFNPIHVVSLKYYPIQSMDGSNPCPTLIQLDGKLYEIWSVHSQKDR